MYPIFSRRKVYVRFRFNKDLIEAIPRPVPASKAMPEWFKKLGRDVKHADISAAGTVKRCIPVLDAISQGYVIPLWADVHIKVTKAYNLVDENGDVVQMVHELKGDPQDAAGKVVDGKTIAKAEEIGFHLWCKFPDGFDLGIGGDVGRHSWEQVGDLCDLKNFKMGQMLLKFYNPWVIETPKGWSVQFKNPANNWSNNIHILEGVVDTDTYHNPVNFPFVWTGSEEGEWVIEKGTPLVQVIPFKRQKTKLEILDYDLPKMQFLRTKLHSVVRDKYRRLFWHKRGKAKLD